MTDHAIGPYWDCDCFTDGENEDKRRVIRASEYELLAARAAKYEAALREIVAKLDGPHGDYEILDFLDIAERGLK
jgi:hypothetical protein